MAGVDEQDIAVDFDEAWDEEDAKAPVIRIKGELIRLPHAMPAKLVLFVTRAKAGAEEAKRDNRTTKRAKAAVEDPKREVKVTEIVDLAGMLIGRERVQGYIDGGMSFERVGEIMRRCMAVYRKDKSDDEDGQGEAKAPKEETGTTSSGSSSSTGASSSPTGAASTTEPISTPS